MRGSKVRVEYKAPGKLSSELTRGLKPEIPEGTCEPTAALLRETDTVSMPLSLGCGPPSGVCAGLDLLSCPVASPGWVGSSG